MYVGLDFDESKPSVFGVNFKTDTSFELILVHIKLSNLSLILKNLKKKNLKATWEVLVRNIKVMLSL